MPAKDLRPFLQGARTKDLSSAGIFDETVRGHNQVTLQVPNNPSKQPIGIATVLDIVDPHRHGENYGSKYTAKQGGGVGCGGFWVAGLKEHGNPLIDVFSDAKFEIWWIINIATIFQALNVSENNYLRNSVNDD
nr:patatin-like protein 1 [Ipomoea batatas]